MESENEESDILLFINRDREKVEILHSFQQYNIVPVPNIIPGLDSNFYEPNEISIPFSITFTILSIVFSLGAILPFTVFPGFLPTTEWDMMCVLRSSAYFKVFLYVWIEAFRSLYRYLLIDTNNSLNYYETRSFRKVICLLFGLFYSSLYCWKWLAMDDLPFRVFSLCCFFVAFAAVFTKLLFRQLVGTLSSPTSKNKRDILLASVSAVEREVNWNYKANMVIAHKLFQSTASPISCLLPLRNDYHLHQVDNKVLLSLYEDDFCDVTKYYVTAVINIFLGVSWIALWITMIEDYGYAIASTTGLDETSYLWLATCLCGLLSSFYVLSSYNLYHRSIRSIYSFITLNNSLSILKSFAYHIPFYFFGGCIASARLAASYTVFGRIAAKFALPYSIGFTLVYTGITIVFILDLITSSRLIFTSVKGFSTLFLSWLFAYFPNFVTSHYFVRYYLKKLKQRIRNLNHDGLDVCIAETLCRE